MKAYPKYKASGIDWLGEIPSHWEVCKIKHRISMVLGKMLQAKKPQRDGYSLEKYLKSRNVSMLEISGLDNLDEMWFSDAEKSLYILKEGDVVMNEGGDIGKAALWQPQSFSCYLQNSVHKLTPNCSINSSFLTYYLATISFMGYFQSIVSQISIAHLTKEKLANTPLIVPPYEEQETIARYLDEVTAKVNALMSEKRAQVEDLRKYRTSLISETVTRGFNPDAPLRSSGIDWLGDIPEHWKLLKMKHCIEITNGSDPQKDGNIPVYGSGATSFKTCGEYKEGPTVLIGRKGATLHIPHWIEGKYWNVDTAFDTKVKDNYILRYFYYIACSFDYEQYKSQTTLPSMTQSAYENAYIPVPPISEQQEIADYLDEKTAKIDSLVEELEAQLNDLATYKQAVITEAVTGKVDVRHWTSKS